MEPARFRRVKCPDSTARWYIADGGVQVHCNVVERSDGTFIWAAWVEHGETMMGDVQHGRSANIRHATDSAKRAAVRLLADRLEDERLGLTGASEALRGGDDMWSSPAGDRSHPDDGGDTGGN